MIWDLIKVIYTYVHYHDCLFRELLFLKNHFIVKIVFSQEEEFNININIYNLFEFSIFKNIFSILLFYYLQNLLCINSILSKNWNREIEI